MDMHELAAEITKNAAKVDRLINQRHERDHLTIPQRIKESYNGWPSGSGYDRTARRSTDTNGEPLPGYSDPVGDAGTQEDRAAADERQILRDLKAAVRNLENAIGYLDRYQLRNANIIERASTDDAAAAGCQSCARIHGPRGGTYWSPVYRRTALANGVLTDLCQWCLTWVRETGELPPKEAVEAHRDGRRVRKSA